MDSDSFHVQLATNYLHQGKIIAYATESVIGLGCDPANLTAVARLLQIKSRAPAKGLILIASDISQLEPWVDFQQVADLKMLHDSWPGHETWLVPARQQVSPLLRGSHSTLAVRVSAHPIVQQLCQHFKAAITSTSANKQGQKEARDLTTARQFFNDEVDYYLPGEIGDQQRPSRIRDALTGQLIRE